MPCMLHSIRTSGWVACLVWGGTTLSYSSEASHDAHRPDAGCTFAGPRAVIAAVRLVKAGRVALARADSLGTYRGATWGATTRMKTIAILKFQYKRKP